MSAHIRMATAADAPAVSNLVQECFRLHIAPDWEPQAQETFLAETTPDKLSAPLSEATFAAVFEEGGFIRGVIVLPRPNLVQLCFVASTHLRRGIGSALWAEARSYIQANLPDVKTVELNASPYAVPAYTAMGFFPISKPFRRRGSVATRMACWLPGRALEHGEDAA
jgi:hypothetical protein